MVMRGSLPPLMLADLRINTQGPLNRVEKRDPGLTQGQGEIQIESRDIHGKQRLPRSSPGLDHGGNVLVVQLRGHSPPHRHDRIHPRVCRQNLEGPGIDVDLQGGRESHIHGIGQTRACGRNEFGQGGTGAGRQLRDPEPGVSTGLGSGHGQSPRP